MTLLYSYSLDVCSVAKLCLFHTIGLTHQYRHIQILNIWATLGGQMIRMNPDLHVEPLNIWAIGGGGRLIRIIAGWLIRVLCLTICSSFTLSAPQPFASQAIFDTEFLTILISVSVGCLFIFIMLTACILRKCRSSASYANSHQPLKKRVVIMQPNALYAGSYKDANSQCFTPLVPQVRIEGGRNRLSSDLTCISEYEIPLDPEWEFDRNRYVKPECRLSC